MMARSYSNIWSRAAARLTQIAHTPAPGFRWLVLLALVAIWFSLGLLFFLPLGVPEAIYRTIAAVSMSDDYFGVSEVQVNAVRFAALAVPVVGLLFAFSGTLGRHLAQTFNLGAARHVVIAGDSPAALSLAGDCRAKKDSVILIGEGLSDDTVRNLRRRGVIVVEGDATRPETLKNARAHHAAHVLAFEPDDTENLHIEAAVRRLVGKARRKPPIGVHVATRSSMLLREAREMRAQQSRKQDKGAPPVDPKPFSLDEIAARLLIQKRAQDILNSAETLQQPRAHILFFGFDEAAEALAAALFKSLWSSRFEPPRVTVLAPDPESLEARFKARHREAFAHPQLWVADIGFAAFDWDAASIHGELLTQVESARGKPCAAVVSTGADPGNIHLAIALKRACNHGNRWPIPIFMKETSQSEFSQEYAHGDDTAELDAYLQAFGGHQETATRRQLLDGAIDRGAAIAHEHYSQNLGERDAMSMKELQAAMKDWSEVLETYRSANRAVADSAAVKVWDMGWRPANKGEKGETAMGATGDALEGMARREHDRWVAERLMSGWRPTADGEKRNNDLMAHDKLVGWDALNEDDRSRDRVQVRAAIDIARATNPAGFVARSG
jgi:hypothetical protein